MGKLFHAVVTVLISSLTLEFFIICWVNAGDARARFGGRLTMTDRYCGYQFLKVLRGFVIPSAAHKRMIL